MMIIARIFCCFNEKSVFKFEKIWPKFKKVKTLFYKGGKKLNKELSIIEIVKTLRKAEIFLHSKYITSKMKEEFFEDEKNYVDLNTSDEEINP